MTKLNMCGMFLALVVSLKEQGYTNSVDVNWFIFLQFIFHFPLFRVKMDIIVGRETNIAPLMFMENVGYGGGGSES
jgi:hypothetical protein